MASTKRRIPPHIVLPNGMWRFVKAGTKNIFRNKARKRRLKVFGGRDVTEREFVSNGGGLLSRRKHRKSYRTGGISVARFKKKRKSPSRGMGGLKIPSVNKLAVIAAVAGGAVLLGGSILPNVDSKLKAAAAGFAVGGIPGAAIGYLGGQKIAQIISGATGSSSAVSGSNTW